MSPRKIPALTLLILLLAGCQSSQAGQPAITATLTPFAQLAPQTAPPGSPTPAASLPPLREHLTEEALEPGGMGFFQDRYGRYFLYRPTRFADPLKILVVIHGTPASDLTAEETAFYYAGHWQAFAEEQGWLLVVPAFNQADFSSRKGEISDALTGYRGLFGREIGADQWVLRLADLVRETLDLPQAPLLLYGHSAGGQFVGRFLVVHPEAVERAVISAAVTYPQPDLAAAWPYGMGPLTSEINWEDGSSESVEIKPDPGTWLLASQVPATVIVGLNDLEPQLSRPGQEGHTRVAIGQHWVEAMRDFAAAAGLESRIRFEAIPSKGHSMLGLLPFCQDALLGN